MRRRGFGMIVAILIATMMMIPVLMLFSSARTRNFTSSGETVSDRALTVADAATEHILNTINTFEFPSNDELPIGEIKIEKTPAGDMVTTTSGNSEQIINYLVAQRLSELNGGEPEFYGNLDDSRKSLQEIQNNFSTYLFKSDENVWYAVWDTDKNKIAANPKGDISDKPIKNLSTEETINGGIKEVDPNYAKDNLWFEVDTNTKYWTSATNEWVITATAYNLSKPEIYRTVVTHAQKGQFSPTGLASGNWYIRKTDVEGSRKIYFSDFEEYDHWGMNMIWSNNGPVRSDCVQANQGPNMSIMYVVNWARSPVYASGKIGKIDDGTYYHNNPKGKFGPDKKDLAWAKANKYAVENFPQSPSTQKNWWEGGRWIFGDKGISDVANAAKNTKYYNPGSTIVFTVEDGVGKVIIDGNKMDLPPNGAIYVSGSATVSGTVKGRVTIAAGGNIYIGGNIVYNTPPRTDREMPVKGIPDALGLIAGGSIIVPPETFDKCPQLEIDAAMLAVSGGFGTEIHPRSDGSPPSQWGAGWEYKRIDNRPPGTKPTSVMEYGSIAQFSALWRNVSSVNENTKETWVMGYEIWGHDYDWNLNDFGPPPYFPVTNDPGEILWDARYEPVINVPDCLKGLSKEQLTEIKPTDPDYNPDFPYKYVCNGTTYYYGTRFYTPSETTSIIYKDTQLYRISWKENIAKKVKP